MPFVEGERVVWHAKLKQKGSPPRPRKYIAAEVVQDGSLRLRIRIELTNGGTALRWVKPENVRRATPELRGETYPHG
jgi:hypothetical protein